MQQHAESDVGELPPKAVPSFWCLVPDWRLRLAGPGPGPPGPTGPDVPGEAVRLPPNSASCSQLLCFDLTAVISKIS